MFLLANSTDTTLSPLTWVNFGVLGLVLAAVIAGKLWAWPAVKQLLLDKEKVEKQRDDLLDSMTSSILPALNDFTTVTKVLLPTLQQLIPLMERATRGTA